MIVSLQDARRVREAIDRAQMMTPDELDQYANELAARKQEMETVLNKLAAARQSPANVVPFATTRDNDPQDGGVA